MIPRLQRFYGNIDWLNIPSKIVNAYAAMMPILEAEEQLTMINNVGVGTGSMKKEDSERIMRELIGLANSRKQKRESNTVTKLMMLSNMGIQVVDMRTKKK